MIAAFDERQHDIIARTIGEMGDFGFTASLVVAQSIGVAHCNSASALTCRL